VELYL